MPNEVKKVDMGDEAKKIVEALAKAFLLVGSWSYVFAAYWNERSIPEAIWALALTMLGVYGIQYTGPKVLAFIKKQLQS